VIENPAKEWTVDVSAAPKVVFDAFQPVYRPNPYPRYALVREHTPLYAMAPGVHLVTRFEECTTVLTDPAWGHGYEEGINPFRPGVAPDEVPGSILRMDPPGHTRMRSLVNKHFTPRNTEGLRPGIERRVNDLIDNALDAGEIDLTADFARPLTISTVGELLGVPPEDYPAVAGWSAEIVYGTDPDILQSAETLARRLPALREFEAYFAELIAQWRRKPGENLLSSLCAAQAAGAELSDPDLFALAVLLLIGGYETTADVIGKGTLALLRNPDQIALWRERPELAPYAVDELLRYEPPVQFTTRVALAERELAGRTFARGEGVVVLIGAANRDPAAYTDPERLDIERYATQPPAPRHLSLSGGIHFCLGAHLGRLEVEIAVGTLLRRAPGLSLADAEPVWRSTIAFHGVESLRVRLRD
jgi:cytochrome P450